LLAVALCVVCSGCSSVATELRKAELLYKDARYEEAQQWLGELQGQAAEMPKVELSRFYYLRGMTAFRLGQDEDALHYLALANQLSKLSPQHLPEGWRLLMGRTLQELTPTTASPHARNPLQPGTT
jgi:uncharacterized protein YceK